MAPSLKHPETDNLDEPLERGELPRDQAAIDAIIRSCATLPVLDTRSDDEILGYDENRLPS